MSATYLLYARSGQEIPVRDELRLIGADVWCGMVIEWMRRGKRRTPQAIEKPALPNYLWATMTPYQFYMAKDIKHLSPTMQVVPYSAERGLREFQKMTDKAYTEADAIRRKAETPPPEFDVGQALKVVGGPFADMVFNFRRIANPDDPLNRKVVVEGPFSEIEIDPLDVVKAG